MCGIGAILRTDGEPVPDAWLEAIDARIAGRGMDGLPVLTVPGRSRWRAYWREQGVDFR